MSVYFSKSTIFISVLILSLCFVAECWNLTENLFKFRKDLFNTKSGKLISFEADDENLKLDLDFTIPFIEIPVQKSMDYAKNFVAKINLPSVVLAGLLVFLSAVVIPTVIMFWNKKMHLVAPFTDARNSTYKSFDEETNPMWRYLSNLDSIFMENNIDSASCLQRSICSLVNKSKEKVMKGTGGSMDKIIDGVSSSEWFLWQILNTPLYPAIRNGLSHNRCTEEYPRCKITQKSINKLVRNILKVIGT